MPEVLSQGQIMAAKNSQPGCAGWGRLNAIGGPIVLDRSINLRYTFVSANGSANKSEDAMAHRITMTDVAREAGVSLMTVSRVVNNKDDVSSATRQRVLDIIDNLGYRPSSIARGLVTQRTGTLGLIVPDIDNPFFSGMVRGAEHEAYAEGYSVFLCNTNEDPERERAVLDSLEEKMVDGLILCSSRLVDEDLHRIVARFPAVVLVSRRLSKDCVGTVLIDDEDGGWQAARHLLESGHRSIGFLAGPKVSHSTRARLKGYRRAMADYGAAENPSWIEHCSPTIERVQVAARQMLKAHPELTGLICHNDLVAIGVLQVCAEDGIRVPEQLAVIGFDDIPVASIVNPPLTTCHVPRHEIGAQAMRLLLEQISDCEQPYQEIVLRPKLVVRSSAP
jgi:LacI family transcriptional regulator